eukprot:757894-Hanusia_phi.AAC.4
MTDQTSGRSKVQFLVSVWGWILVGFDDAAMYSYRNRQTFGGNGLDPCEKHIPPPLVLISYAPGVRPGRSSGGWKWSDRGPRMSFSRIEPEMLLGVFVGICFFNQQSFRCWRRENFSSPFAELTNVLISRSCYTSAGWSRICRTACTPCCHTDSRVGYTISLNIPPVPPDRALKWGEKLAVMKQVGVYAWSQIVINATTMAVFPGMATNIEESTLGLTRG